MQLIKLSLAAALLLSSPTVFAAGDASQALQTVQWATAEIGNAMNLSKQLEQIALLTQTLQQNIQAVQMAQQNLQALSAMDFSNFNTYVDQLANVMVATNGISYQMGNLDTRFGQLFPGYDEHTRIGAMGDIRGQASSYAQYYRTLTDANRGTVLGTLRNLAAVNNDLRADQLSMNMLKLQSRNAVGNKSAIQAANEIAMHQTETIKKLHSTMLAQTNLMAQNVADENERRALREAKKDAWLTGGKKPIKGDEKDIKTW
ncbi:MAG: hypothetical protein AB1763_10745 [Campylobacterota bacterium]